MKSERMTGTRVRFSSTLCEIDLFEVIQCSHSGTHWVCLKLLLNVLPSLFLWFTAASSL